MRIPWVDEESLIQACPALFHYTRAVNLEPILRSGGLLATHHAKTNDRAEFRALQHFMIDQMCQEALPTLRRRLAVGDVGLDIPEDQIEAVMKEDAKTFFDILIEKSPCPAHIVCFSAHDMQHHKQNGLLTMWRMYGGVGEGIALGFRTERLVRLTERMLEEKALNSIYLDRVGYGAEDAVLKARLADAPMVPQLYAAFLIALLERREEMSEDAIESLMQFLVLSSSAKHPDFEDEREVRLTVMEAIPGTEKGRPKLGGPEFRLLVPCLEALDEVIVGPSDRQDELFGEVRNTLDACGYPQIAVRRSATPFRHV